MRIDNSCLHPIKVWPDTYYITESCMPFQCKAFDKYLQFSEINRKWTDELTGNNQYCKYRYVKFGKTAVIIGNLAANNNNNISITFPFAFKFTPSASVTLESAASSNVNPLITEISTTSFRADSTPGSTSKTAARFIIIGEIE